MGTYSWEHIRDFIERSGQSEFIQLHLKRVLAREQFDLLLQQLADQMIGTVTPVCQIVYDAAESKMLLSIIHKIEAVLKKIGFIVKQTADQMALSTPLSQNIRIIHLSQTHTGADIITIADYPTPEALMMKVLETVVGEGALKELKASFDGGVLSLTSEACSDSASQSFLRHPFQRLRLRQFAANIKRYNHFAGSLQ